MSDWPSVKARQVLAALLRIGWSTKREAKGSHRVLARSALRCYTSRQWMRKGKALRTRFIGSFYFSGYIECE